MLIALFLSQNLDYLENSENFSDKIRFSQDFLILDDLDRANLNFCFDLMKFGSKQCGNIYWMGGSLGLRHLFFLSQSVNLSKVFN